MLRLVCTTGNLACQMDRKNQRNSRARTLLHRLCVCVHERVQVPTGLVKTVNNHAFACRRVHARMHACTHACTNTMYTARRTVHHLCPGSLALCSFRRQPRSCQENYKESHCDARQSTSVATEDWMQQTAGTAEGEAGRNFERDRPAFQRDGKQAFLKTSSISALLATRRVGYHAVLCECS